MRANEIVEFVKRNVDPLPPSAPYGARYRVAGTLVDGTQLPCIVVESAPRTVDLALKRFEQTKTSDDPRMGYRAVVQSFVTEGNTVNDYDLRELSLSPYAIPLSRIREINGETSMSWTEFYAIMTDGKEFRFGTTFLIEFFDMPSGYSAADIAKICSCDSGRASSPRTYPPREAVLHLFRRGALTSRIPWPDCPGRSAIAKRGTTQRSESLPQKRASNDSDDDISRTVTPRRRSRTACLGRRPKTSENVRLTLGARFLARRQTSSRSSRNRDVLF